MILNESSCIFCFLIANPLHIYSEKFLILIYLINCPKMFSSNQNQLFLVSHAQLCLDHSDSKILEALIIQEKSKLFSCQSLISFFSFLFFFFFFYYGVPWSVHQEMLRVLRYRDAFLFIFFIIIILMILL